MKIVVNSKDGTNIILPFPTGLMLNSAMAGIGIKYLKQYGINISKKQSSAFIKELNRFRRKHRDWVLVEVQSADGDYVKIKLQKKGVFKNEVKGFLCPKMHTEKKKYESTEKVQVLKILISTGDSYFKIQSLKIGINRQPLFFVQ